MPHNQTAALMTVNRYARLRRADDYPCGQPPAYVAGSMQLIADGWGTGAALGFTGDGLMATFDGPARAVQCFRTLGDRLSELGLSIRAGAHTGEVELIGDDIGGIAVHIAARISSLARAGEVLASSTVRDLVAGSGLEFEDRGDHELKGVPGTWRVLAVR